MKNELKSLEDVLPRNIVEGAVEKHGVGALNALLDFSLRLKAEQARIEYNTALAKALSSVPPVRKNRSVDYSTRAGGKVKYEYADLGALMDAVSKPLHENGFCIKFTTKLDNTERGGYIATTTLTLSHVGGHAESSELSMPVALADKMSAMQSIAGTVTFTKRYLVSGALGVVIDADDTEQRLTSFQAKPKARNASVSDSVQEVKKNIAKAILHNFISMEEGDKIAEYLDEKPSEAAIERAYKKINITELTKLPDNPVEVEYAE